MGVVMTILIDLVYCSPDGHHPHTNQEKLLAFFELLLLHDSELVMVEALAAIFDIMQKGVFEQQEMDLV